MRIIKIVPRYIEAIKSRGEKFCFWFGVTVGYRTFIRHIGTFNEKREFIKAEDIADECEYPIKGIRRKRSLRSLVDTNDDLPNKKAGSKSWKAVCKAKKQYMKHFCIDYVVKDDNKSWWRL